MTTTSGSVYYHHDGLGNTIAITNGNAEVLERYSYDVFGRVNVVDASTGNSIPQSAHGVRHFYTGHDFQAELGLYLTHYRAYEPVLGRWLSADPIGEKGGWNLYGYVSNNPINMIDPNGLWGIGWGDGDGNVSRKIGCGDPTLLFTPESWDDLKRGAAASADGFIPFADPFQEHYDPRDIDTAISKALGEFSRNTLLTAAGLRAGAALGGTKLGHGLNHNPNLRIGPGRMPARGGLPAGPKVPRMSIGKGPGNPHIDLRVRPLD
jgi:RHS repeat-associated protein